MTKKLPQFTASQFTPTKFDTAQEKAKFANACLKFLVDGCPKSYWIANHVWFYEHWSLHMGHIAHYNAEGFYEARFASRQGRIATIEQAAGKYGFHGDPAYTWSDVQRALAEKIVDMGLVESYKEDLKVLIEREERAELARLKEKYESR